MIAVQGSDFGELVKICEERLKHDDSSRNRVIYAKALDSANLVTEAIEQARKAVAVDPNDLMARLCAGALLLKHPDTTRSDSEMRQHFSKALELIDAMAQAGKKDELAAAYFLNTAIVLALDGREDESRELLQKLKRRDIDNEKYRARIREIEMVIGK